MLFVDWYYSMLTETKIEEIKEVIQKNQTAKAHLLWQELRLDTDEAAKIWIVPLKIVALPLLVDTEVFDLFKEDIGAVGTAHHIPVAERLKRRLGMVSEDQLDEFIERLISEGNANNKKLIDTALEYDLSKSSDTPVDDHAVQDMSLVDDMQKVQFQPQTNPLMQDMTLHKILLSEQRTDAITHHFDSQDAKEIDWHRNIVPDHGLVLDYHKIAEALMHKYSLQLEEELVLKRFETVLAAQIKGLRTKKQTLALLVRGHKIGGLEIAEETAHQIVQEIEDHYPAAQNGEQIVASVPAFSAPPQTLVTSSAVPAVSTPTHHALQSAVDRPDAQKISLGVFAQPSSGETQSNAQSPQSPSIPLQQTPIQSIETQSPSPSSIRQDEVNSTSLQQASMPQKVIVRKVIDPQKPKMQDIAPVRPASPQVLGTVEQLGTISLDDVRMSPHGVRDIFARVQHEITMMAQQSYDKRLAAIRQWRQSPLYKQYVSIGNRAMQEAKQVAQIISEGNTEGLTQEEFDAIADFNSELE